MEEPLEKCEYMHVHEDIVHKVNEQMPDEEILYDLAELFKIFGDSTRIKILYALFESEMCVCDIAQPFKHDPVRYFSPASLPQAKQAGEVSQRRKNSVLFPWRMLM